MNFSFGENKKNYEIGYLLMRFPGLREKNIGTIREICFMIFHMLPLRTNPQMHNTCNFRLLASLVHLMWTNKIWTYDEFLISSLSCSLLGVLADCFTTCNSSGWWFLCSSSGILCTFSCISCSILHGASNAGDWLSRQWCWPWC
jgi:hypothetical protein